MTDGGALGMTPILRVANVSKTYPGVRALHQVGLEVLPGEIHAVIVENGAGKSTLMKIIFGVTQPDAGTIEVHGRPVTIGSPVEAQRLGISMVHQELTLVPALDVGRNIYLGREPGLALGVIDWPRLYADAEALLHRLHLPLDPRRVVRGLSTAQKQMVEIARALSWKSTLLIMDEPTSSLTQGEIRELFRILRDLKADRVSVLYISHRLEELPEIADRVTVMRDGRTVGTVEATTPIPSMIRMMVGRSVDQQFPRIQVPIGDEVLRVEGLTREGVVQNVSFSVRAGEIVGMAGLVGAGRSETARMIAGIDAKDSGRVYVDGHLVDIGSPSEAIAAGVALLPEDRKQQGLVLPLSVKTNLSLATLPHFTRFGIIAQRKRDVMAQRFVQDLRIRTPSLDFRVRNLSGGNQQKVVLGKWLGSQPRVLIFDEPTRGIDVGAKVEVYQEMNALIARGVGILLISSELPEVLGMSDRVLVMYDGRLVADLPATEATPERVIALASGEETVQLASVSND